MIEHPLIAYIEDLDRHLDEIIDTQKYLHSVSALGKTTDKQTEDIRELDEIIKEFINVRNMEQKTLFEQTHLVILHDWEWDIKDPLSFFFRKTCK